MNFGGIGGGELLVILVIALIVFGPGRLVEVASSLGKALREFRKMSQDLTTELQKELEVTKELTEELEKELQPLTGEETKKGLQKEPQPPTGEEAKEEPKTENQPDELPTEEE